MSQPSLARDGASLRFLTYNILDGGRGREGELTAIIAGQQPDVILLQEVSGREFVQNLACQLGHEFFIATSNSALNIALLTRLPIVNAAAYHPNILRHTCLQATLEYAPGQTLMVMGVHLGAPAYTLPIEVYRLRELRLILNHMSHAGIGRVVIGGDFNSIAPGDRPDFSRLPFRLRLSIFLQGGTVARQVIATMRGRGFTDAFRELNPGERGFTFPSSQPNTRLDYFFVNAALRPHLRKCAVILTPPGVKSASDHLPLLMQLAL